MDEQTEFIPPTESEKQLIEKFVQQRQFVDDLKIQLAEATKERDDLEARIIKNLADEGKQASARYDGLGHVIICVGAAHASIQKGMAEEVQKYLKNIGREDMVKETVAASSLSAYVRECLQKNDPIPEGVSFYIPQFLRFYEAK